MDTTQQQQQQQRWNSQSEAGAQHPPQQMSNPAQGSQWRGELQQPSALQPQQNLGFLTGTTLAHQQFGVQQDVAVMVVPF